MLNLALVKKMYKESAPVGLPKHSEHVIKALKASCDNRLTRKELILATGLSEDKVRHCVQKLNQMQITEQFKLKGTVGAVLHIRLVKGVSDE